MLYSQGKVTPEMKMVALCEKMGWTYQQYLAQPTFFLDLLWGKLDIDAQIRERNIAKQNKL